MRAPDTLATAARTARGALQRFRRRDRSAARFVPAQLARTAGALRGFAAPDGFPSPEDAARVYDETDLNRAIQAYRFFYPTVSMAAVFRGSETVGIQDNAVFGILSGAPLQVVFTANSDTPYAGVPLDLHEGPMLVEMPEGPLIGVADDLNQRWVADLGLPGPDAGRGGVYALVPPEYSGDVPREYHVGRSTTYRVYLIIRSLPVHGDLAGAKERIKAVKITPLHPPLDWTPPRWIDVSERALDATPLEWERNIRFWEVLHTVIDSEPPFFPYRTYYGELAALGILKGKAFTPDPRMRAILEKAARIAHDELWVRSFADRRPERIVFRGRQWEWLALRAENGFFDAPTHVDLEAREKFFFQAIFESPAMFRRRVGSGSLYFMSARDRTGAYLEGKKTYRLTIPSPVPASLFWSITVYDAHTRSEIRTDQGTAALRSLFELQDAPRGAPLHLYFGPKAPRGEETRFIRTIPRKGWFAYLRLYGPEAAAFNGAWRPGDFEEIR